MLDKILKLIDINKLMSDAAKAGDIDVVKFAMEHGADNYSWTMYYAGRLHMDIFKLLRKKI